MYGWRTVQSGVRALNEEGEEWNAAGPHDIPVKVCGHL